MIWHVGPYIGQKVVCIDDTIHHFISESRVPKLNEIYQIVCISTPRQLGFRSVPDETCLAFWKTNNSAGWSYWSITRFRPLLEKPTDISALRQLINKPNMSVYDAPRIRENV